MRAEKSFDFCAVVTISFLLVFGMVMPSYVEAQADGEKVRQMFDGVYIVTSKGEIKEVRELEITSWNQGSSSAYFDVKDFANLVYTDVKGIIIKGRSFVDNVTFATARRVRKTGFNPFSKEKKDFEKTLMKYDSSEQISSQKLRKRSIGDRDDAVYIEITEASLYGNVKEGTFLLISYISQKNRDVKLWMFGLDDTKK